MTADGGRRLAADHDKSGMLDETELMKVFELIGEKVSRFMVQAMLRKIDDDGNGTISPGATLSLSAHLH
jgi:Ca2+-binding EF-hand superfamily protein